MQELPQFAEGGESAQAVRIERISIPGEAGVASKAGRDHRKTDLAKVAVHADSSSQSCARCNVCRFIASWVVGNII